MKVYIGQAGVPISCPKRDTLSGIKYTKQLGLNLMEIQFVRGVRMKEETAKMIREFCEENDFRVSIHAPYYINLASDRKEVIEKSINEWIYKSAYLGDIMGAKFIVFHPATYKGRPKEQVFEIVKENLIKALEKIEDFNVFLCPETTGKKGQFGSLNEIIKLVKEIDHPKLLFCLDFAHMHARESGIFRKKDDFLKVFRKIEEELGEKYLKVLHIHFSSIEYGEKGEKQHLPIDHEEPSFMEFAKALKEIKDKVEEINIVNESPLLEKDALKMKKILEAKGLLGKV